jgi:ribosome-binding factor A
MNWQKTRQIILTINPKLFRDGQESYEVVKQKKAISQFILEVKRGLGVKVEEYVSIIEWYTNGHPHWHILIQQDKKGRFGKIGKKKLEKYWKYGHVWETYFRTYKHWQNFTGYFDKVGYFCKTKNHQSKLPAWALQYKKKIRRWTASVKKKKTQPNILEIIINSLKKEIAKLNNERRKMMRQVKEAEILSDYRYNGVYNDETITMNFSPGIIKQFRKLRKRSNRNSSIRFPPTISFQISHSLL